MAQIDTKQHLQVHLISGSAHCDVLDVLCNICLKETRPHLNCFTCPTFKEEQSASGRGGDHALSVCPRAKDQAADGGEQRLCLSPPPPPVFLHHRRRDGAAPPPLTPTLSVAPFFFLPTPSTLPQGVSPHHTQPTLYRTGRFRSFSSWLLKRCTKWKLIGKRWPGRVAAHRGEESLRGGGSCRCSSCPGVSSVWLRHFCGVLLRSWLVVSCPSQKVKTCESMSVTKVYHCVPHLGERYLILKFE